MTTAAPHAHGVHFGRKDIENTGMGVGIFWMLVGVLGFIPGITAAYGSMTFAGPDSHAMFLGVFQVSALLNIVQFAIGVVGFIMARSAMGARNFLMGGGLLYLIIAVYSMVVGVGSSANFLALNAATGWAMIIVGVLMVAAGWLLARVHTDQT
jgi:hypothetical protein